MARRGFGARLSRRTLLRGVGGVGVGLPALEIMQPRRAAAATRPPTRYVFCYAGISIGRDRAPRDALTPDKAGPNYDLQPGLAPLADLNLTQEVTVVSRLLIPSASDASKLPPGGRSGGFHFNTTAPQISGVQGLKGSTRWSPSSDQRVYDTIGGNSQHLIYRVQAASYVGGNGVTGGAGRLSYKQTAGGKVVGVDPTINPYAAYTSLFGNFAGPNDTGAARQIERTLQQRRSVLDLVADGARALIPRLGYADRDRIEQHFDEVRALEGRLAKFVPQAGGTVCRKPDDPGDRFNTHAAAIHGGSQYSTTEGYSNEEERAELLSDMIQMGFACNIARVAVLQYTFWKCYMNAFKFSGYKANFHGLTHGKANPAQHAQGVAWYVKLFGQLVDKLRKTPEVDGSNVLDHSALVLCWEGGHGSNPADDAVQSHSTENMVCLVAGGAGGLKRGHHIVAKGVHPAKVTMSAMKAVGAKPELGELSGALPALFV